jgi:small subunit ribosomal protein S6
MPLYEHIFLARQDVSGQQVDALIEQFKTLVEEHGGSVGRVENWGIKTLAYRMNKNRKAHYALMDIDAPPAALHELERQQRLHEDVLRYLTIKVPAHEDGPSVMKQKRERDDRRRRDRGPREGGPPEGRDRDRDREPRFRDDRPPRREHAGDASSEREDA